MLPLRPRTFIWVVIIVIPLVVAIVYVKHVLSSRPLTVLYKNVTSASVYDTSGREAGGDDILLGKITESGDTIRIPKNLASVMVIYKGAGGYADGLVGGDTRQVNIDPEFSAEKIAGLVTAERSQIESAVFSGLQNQSSYTLGQGTLFDHGAWYISKLTYENSTDANSDTLRVLLRKEGDEWQRIGFPALVFTTYSTKNIPLSVLDAVNTY